MKQKIVMRLPADDAKSRARAMKIAVTQPGVISATLEGTEQTKIVVVGDGVDSVQLTARLRKKMGFTELVSVSKVEEKKEEKKENTEGLPLSWPLQYAGPHYVYQYVPDHTQDNCAIM